MPSFVSNIQCFWDGVFCCLKRSAADEEEKVVERQKKLAHHLEAPFPSYGTDCTSAENSQGPHVPPLNISNQVPRKFSTGSSSRRSPGGIGSRQSPHSNRSPSTKVPELRRPSEQSSTPKQGQGKAEKSPKSGDGVLALLGAGKLSTLAGASEARRHRCASCSIQVLAEPQNVDASELCREGRTCVRAWAAGKLSGLRCMLRLETCSSVVLQLADFPRDKQAGEAVLSGAVLLWSVGCAGLGGGDARLEGLRQELETKIPKDVLQDALEAMQNAQEPQDWDRGLRRLAKKAWCAGSDPCAFLKVQVWREVFRAHLGLQDDDAGHEMKLMTDESVLKWFKATNKDIIEAASMGDLQELKNDTALLSEYKPQVVRMVAQLKEALNEWKLFGAYHILGVRPGISAAKLRRAFHKKALRLHPDKGGDKAAFQELRQVYGELLAELEAQEKEEGADISNAEHDADDFDEAQPENTADPENTEEDMFMYEFDCDEKDHEADLMQDAETPQFEPEQETCEAEDPPQSEEPEVEPTMQEDGGPPIAEASSSESDFEDNDPRVDLNQVATEGRQAADCTQETAAEVLRLCRAAQEAIRTHHWAEGREQAAAAIAASKLMTEAAMRTVVCTGKVTDASLDHNSLMKSGPMKMSRQSTQATGDASVAVQHAAAMCMQAVREATDALAVSHNTENVQEVDGLVVEQSVEEKESEQAMRICNALQALTGITEHLQLATCDATDAADQVVSDLEAQQQSLSPEAVAVINELIETLHTLTCANKELLDLQRAGEALTQRRGRASVECRLRAFQILSEMLDEAVMSFTQAMEEALRERGDDMSIDDLAVGILDKTFGWVLQSSSHLALPMDPRSQILRAAVAVDLAAACELLLVQVVQKIEEVLQEMLRLDARHSVQDTQGKQVICDLNRRFLFIVQSLSASKEPTS